MPDRFPCSFYVASQKIQKKLSDVKFFDCKSPREFSTAIYGNAILQNWKSSKLLVKIPEGNPFTLKDIPNINTF
jgi:hypothetical protein